MRKQIIAARSDIRLIEATCSDGSSVYDVEFSHIGTGSVVTLQMAEGKAALVMYNLFCDSVIGLQIHQP